MVGVVLEFLAHAVSELAGGYLVLVSSCLAYAS